jgi:hypothetical protein
MGMNVVRMTCLSIVLASMHLCHASSSIILSLRPYPEQKVAPQEKLSSDMKTPGKLTKKILKNYGMKPGGTEGVLATYMGFVAVSSVDGQISFIRNHKNPGVTILISQVIEPIMMLSNIVHHWEIKPDVPARMYTMQRIQDEETKLYYWDTQEVTLPENRRISLETIVIFAKPDNIVVPTGITLTEGGPQLVLPTIYTRKGFNLVPRSLVFLKIRHFFGPQSYTIKKATPELSFSSQLKP